MLILVLAGGVLFAVNNSDGGNPLSFVLDMLRRPDDLSNLDYIKVNKPPNSAYAKAQLSEELQESYDLLDQYVYKFNSEVDKIKVHKDDFRRLLEHYRADNPQAFWLSSTYQFQSLKQTEEIVSAKLSFSYRKGTETESTEFTLEQVEQMSAEMERAADEILAGITPEMSEYERVLYLHDYLAMNVKYDDSYEFQHIAYGALVDKKAVCDGYATAMQYLLNKIGIECRIVFGDDKEGLPYSHAWNIVKVENKYYHLDVTWDLPMADISTPIYTNFLVDTNQIEKRHIVFSPVGSSTSDEYWYYPAIPETNSSEMNYYRQNGLYVEDLSDNSVQQILLKANEGLANHQEYVQFHFKNKKDLDHFYSEVDSYSKRVRKNFPYTTSSYETFLLFTKEKESDPILFIQFKYLQ